MSNDASLTLQRKVMSPMFDSGKSYKRKKGGKWLNTQIHEEFLFHNGI